MISTSGVFVTACLIASSVNVLAQNVIIGTQEGFSTTTIGKYGKIIPVTLDSAPADDNFTVYFSSKKLDVNKCQLTFNKHNYNHPQQLLVRLIDDKTTACDLSYQTPCGKKHDISMDVTEPELGKDAATCNVWGDPHVDNFDGASTFDVQPANIYVDQHNDSLNTFTMVKNQYFTVQGRFDECFNNKTCVNAAAVSFWDNVIVADIQNGTDGHLFLRVQNFREGNALKINSTKSNVQVISVNGFAYVEIAMKSWQPEGWTHPGFFLDVKTVISPALKGTGLTGVCGNYDGKKDNDCNSLDSCKATVSDWNRNLLGCLVKGHSCPALDSTYHRCDIPALTCPSSTTLIQSSTVHPTSTPVEHKTPSTPSPSPAPGHPSPSPSPSPGHPTSSPVPSHPSPSPVPSPAHPSPSPAPAHPSPAPGPTPSPSQPPSQSPQPPAAPQPNAPAYTPRPAAPLPAPSTENRACQAIVNAKFDCGIEQEQKACFNHCLRRCSTADQASKMAEQQITELKNICAAKNALQAASQQAPSLVMGKNTAPPAPKAAESPLSQCPTMLPSKENPLSYGNSPVAAFPAQSHPQNTADNKKSPSTSGEPCDSATGDSSGYSVSSAASVKISAFALVASAVVALA
ncbi:hypothetical protein MP228_005951 [Amoeboaphelidium protococcarum]|nr:hypothetical protein MP228_005951 [Amoeboaphelidium protococcarum]